VNPSQPVQRVCEILRAGGFELTASPLRIASMEFLFAAILIAHGRLDLVVVIDTVEDQDEKRLLQRLEALARALDLATSHRALTVVFVGPKPSDSFLGAASRVCRVLPVGVGEGQGSLRDWLSVLLPMPLPVSSDSSADTLAELKRRLPPTIDPKLTASLVSSAAQGQGAVERTFVDGVAEPLRLSEKEKADG
jgi:hypothetical protein